MLPIDDEELLDRRRAAQFMTDRLAAFLEAIKRLRVVAAGYLETRWDRPPVDAELLKVLSAITDVADAIVWLEGRGQRLWWLDAWFITKAGRAKEHVQQVVHFFGVPHATVQLQPGCPETPAQWLHFMTFSALNEAYRLGKVMFEEFCRDHACDRQPAAANG